MGRLARNLWRWGLLLALVGVVLARQAGAWLIVDDPRASDLIVALAGEAEQRPAKGLELMARGLAPRMALDVPAGTRLYRWSQLELAQQYVSGLAEAEKLSVCPIKGLSTRDEARDVAGCLATGVLGQAHIRSVLLVTSDFHTRRALSIFRKEIPGVEFRVAAAYDSAQYGAKWWQHREWAKTFFDEWVRLVWWNGVERWRG